MPYITHDQQITNAIRDQQIANAIREINDHIERLEELLLSIDNQLNSFIEDNFPDYQD